MPRPLPPQPGPARSPARPAPDHARGFCKTVWRQVERAALERALEQSAAELAGSQPPAGELAAAGQARPGASAGAARGGHAAGAGGAGGALWVDRYRPRAYFDLLSDEATNRETLRRARGALQHAERWRACSPQPMLTDLRS